MYQTKACGNPDMPLAMAYDGNDSYVEAMLETDGNVLDSSG